MADERIVILDERDENEILFQISTHINADNPHGITIEKIGAAALPTISTITLLSSAWDTNTLTQSVYVSGVLEDESQQIINVSPASSSVIDAANSIVYCSGQSKNALTFTCLEKPTNDIVYNVNIQRIAYVG